MKLLIFAYLIFFDVWNKGKPGKTKNLMLEYSRI